MHTTMISASMTAYSTAVGPSSFFRKLTTDWLNLRIGYSSQGVERVSAVGLLGTRLRSPLRCASLGGAEQRVKAVQGKAGTLRVPIHAAKEIEPAETCPNTC